jgi:hypothetical protein
MRARVGARMDLYRPCLQRAGPAKGSAPPPRRKSPLSRGWTRDRQAALPRETRTMRGSDRETKETKKRARGYRRLLKRRLSTRKTPERDEGEGRRPRVWKQTPADQWFGSFVLGAAGARRPGGGIDWLRGIRPAAGRERECVSACGRGADGCVLAFFFSGEDGKRVTISRGEK